MRAQTEATIKSSLASEMRKQFNADVQAALAATRSQITNELRAQLNMMLTEAANASATETRRQLNEFVQAVHAAREEDRRTTLLLFEKMQKQHCADYLSLRSDLETVASLTDEEIRRARQSLIQFAANKSNQSSKP